MPGERVRQSKLCQIALALAVCAISSWVGAWFSLRVEQHEPRALSLQDASICGIFLTMTQADVRQALGPPQRFESDGAWIYESSHTIRVIFDDEGRACNILGDELKFRDFPEGPRGITRSRLRSLLGEPHHIQAVDLKWSESWSYRDSSTSMPINLYVWFDRRPIFSGAREFCLRFDREQDLQPPSLAPDGQ